MRFMPCLAASLLAASLAAQAPDTPNWRIGLGLGTGNFDYDTDGSDLDGDTDAGFFRLGFEGVGRRGFGGGFTIDSFASDDDLFASAGFDGVDATNSSYFGHFTYRLDRTHFLMPIRAGLLVNDLTLEESDGDQLEFVSVGFGVEVEPEFVLANNGRVCWSLYGKAGLALGATAIEVDGDDETYSSSTTFVGLEIGTRLRIRAFEVGLGFTSRFQSTDESDPENGVLILGNDVRASAAILQFAVVF